tara:strand:- start:202 stop:1176 length:975 start_codon:yes stop_codon:yes gene_type:complete
MMQRYKNGGSIPRNAMIAGQPHELSYITPTEAEILMGLGGAGVPVGPEQVPAYFDFGISVDADDTGNATAGPGAFGGEGLTSAEKAELDAAQAARTDHVNMNLFDEIKAATKNISNITKSIAKKGGIPGLTGLAMKDFLNDTVMSARANKGLNFGQISRAQQEANLAARTNDDGTRTYSDAEIAEHLNATEANNEAMRAINLDSNRESKPSDYVDLLDTEIEMDPCPEGFVYDEEAFACVPKEDNYSRVNPDPVPPPIAAQPSSPPITPYTPYTNTFIPTPLQPYQMDPVQQQLSALKKAVQPSQGPRPRPRPGLAGIMQVRPE